MKNFFRSFLALIAATLAALASAQTPAPFPANMSSLASKYDLAISLLQRVDHGSSSVSVNSQTVQVPDNTFSVPNGLTAATLGPVVDAATQFNVSYLNSADYVFVWSQLFDASGAELFYGGSAARAVAAPSGYVLTPIKRELYVAWQVPIDVGKNIVSAKEIVTDPLYGTTNAVVPLTVVNGLLQYQSDLSGKGILVLTAIDGTQMAYDLTNHGVRIQVVTVLATTQTTIHGIAVLKNPTVIDTMFQSYQGVGESSAFEVTMTNAGIVNAAVYTSEGALPLGYWVRAPGDTQATFFPLVGGKYSVPLSLKVGTTYIIPDWDSSQFRESDPYIEGVSGKGGA